MPRFYDDLDDDAWDDQDEERGRDWDDEDSDPGRNSLSERVHAVLNHADYFELLTINPNRGSKRRPKGETFHGWPVVGVTVLTDEAAQHELLAALNQGLADWSGSESDCDFEPHYAFRAGHGEHTVDALICFLCGELAVYLDDQEAEWLHLSQRPALQRTIQAIYEAAGLIRKNK